MKNSKNIIVAAIHPWNFREYRRWLPPQDFRKVLISRREDLNFKKIGKLNPRYIFFPHWSRIIPPEIYENFECVVFHMTDLPFGRGGSPLQNLIARGIYKTKISALRAIKDLDASPIYLKKPLDLEFGSAQEPYAKAAGIVFGMISEIIKNNPRPAPQRGRAVIFKRRKPDQSALPPGLRPKKLYDFIRMLDAENYPRAFMECANRRLEFSAAMLKNNSVWANVIIKNAESKQ